ncbi:MAG: hypothetical protein EPGJADBJ_00169 [Saprospiraceae bacterium]|nr:hypothetical protein [Saprospiraceae bacterium]
MKNEFDNKVTEKGWQSMRRLLDREMPEQRRRRFVWWPLALFLLPLAVAGGWWLCRQSTPEQVEQAPAATPVVSDPVAGGGTEDKKSNRILNTNEAGFPQNAPASDFSEKAGNAPDEKRVSGAGFPSGHTLPEPILAHTPAEQASNHAASASTDFPSRLLRTPNVSDATTQIPTPDDAAPGENATHSRGLNYLPVIPQFVENEIINAPELPTVGPYAVAPTKKHTGPERWSFGLTAGLSSEQLSSLNGFTGGAVANWQFHRKWGLRSGIQYAQYRFPGDERPVVTLDALEYADATGNIVNLNTGGSGTPSPNVSSPEVLVPVEQLRQLEMPLLAYWQPLLPLRIFAGITTSYALSAEASNTSYANNQTYLTADKAAQKNLDDLTSSTLSRWQMHLQTGAGVRISRRFELDAFYRYGFPQTAADPITLDQNGQYDPSPSQPADNAGASHFFLLNGIWFF